MPVGELDVMRRSQGVSGAACVLRTATCALNSLPTHDLFEFRKPVLHQNQIALRLRIIRFDDP